MTRVLIAGCGDVGTQLGLALARRGDEVWGLRRRPADLPAPLEPLAGDLCDPASLPEWPAGIDLVFYTAAADRTDEHAYRSAYVAGLANVLTSLTAQHQAPRRLFFTSSTGVYGQSHGEWVDESSATAPTHFTGRILLEAERVAASSPIRATIVRLAGIYGPGRTRLIEGVRRGELGCHSGQPEWSNRIHRDDCAGLLAHLASLDEPESVYIGVDDEPTDRCTIYHWLADRLGVPSPHRQGAPADDASRRGAGKRCSNTRLRASGYRLTFPTFRDGYRRILEDGEPGATLP